MARFSIWGILALTGAVAFVMALGFGWGRGPQIGSAPLPIGLSAGLVIVSVLALIVPGQGDAHSPDWRPFAAVVGAVVLFIAIIETLGLIPATVLSMVAAYLGQTERKFTGFLIYTLCFAAGAWLLFSKGLGLPVPAFGS